MLGCSIIVLFVKTAQSIFTSTIVKNVTNGMRREVYEKVLRKDIGWHDLRENNAGVVGNILNHHVNSLSTVAIEAAALSFEAFSALLIGIVFCLIYSWPIMLALLIVGPLMALGSKVGQRVKMK